MDTLRIILILGGIALLAGIYLWDRIKARRGDESERWQDIEIEGGAEGRSDPLIDNSNPFDDEWEVVPIPARRDTAASDDSLEGLKGISTAADDDPMAEGPSPQAAAHDAAEPSAAPQEEVIVLSLMAGEGRLFNGMQLLDAMELCGLSHGEMGIFHYTELESGEPLFSVANVLEPGSFDLNAIGELETPGLALFMRLPAPIDGEKALLTFVQQAKRLREQLAGVLTDGRRRELTRETLDELKETARRYRVTAE